MPATDGLAEDLATLREAAREAGHLALEMRARVVDEAWEKTPGNPVTDGDLAVNTLLARRLGAARPGYGWLSEETVDDHSNRLNHRRTWVVDPIDGTRAYIKGTPDWCVGLAVVEDGVAVAGVIYEPIADRLYDARLGGGAWLNGNRIFVSSVAQLTAARLIAARPPQRKKDRPPQDAPIQFFEPKPGATLLRMAYVAAGVADGVVAIAQKSDWDLAPGAILIAEAGGRATTHRGQAFDFNREEPAQASLLAAGKALHPLLMRRLEQMRVGQTDSPKRASQAESRPENNAMAEAPDTAKQLLHIVIGGELKDVTGVEFEDLARLDFVGAFPNYKAAYDAWKSAAQRTVDNAEMRYFILHAHKLLDPETGSHHSV